MVKKPKNVCLNGNCLAWLPVPCAAGYDVYLNDVYLETVKKNKITVSESGEYSVAAFQKGVDTSAYSERTIAKTLYEIMTSSDEAPNFVKEGYELVFEDNFNEMIDSSKWKTRQPWGPDVITNNENEYYPDVLNGDLKEPSPFSHEDNQLIITGSKTTNNTNGQDYVSGVISTYGLHDWQYGYFEARIKAPSEAVGFWAAFWLYALNFSGDEIDIAEFADGTADWGQAFTLQALSQAYHFDDGCQIDSNGLTCGEAKDSNGAILNADNGFSLPSINSGEFNTVGCLWEPDRLIFYVNGVEVNSIVDAEKITALRCYLIINLAIGGFFVGLPEDADFPAQLVIDYVKVYQSKEGLGAS